MYDVLLGGAGQRMGILNAQVGIRIRVAGVTGPVCATNQNGAFSTDELPEFRRKRDPWKNVSSRGSLLNFRRNFNLLYVSPQLRNSLDQPSIKRSRHH